MYDCDSFVTFAQVNRRFNMCSYVSALGTTGVQTIDSNHNS